MFTTSGTYPWSFVTQIFHNGQPSHRYPYTEIARFPGWFRHVNKSVGGKASFVYAPLPLFQCNDVVMYVVSTKGTNTIISV